MPRRNWQHAAGLIWPILAAAAERHETVTYSEIAPSIPTNPHSVGWALDPIQRYCVDRGLPPLTSIVIGKTTGQPGSGFTAADTGEIGAVHQKVYAFDWSALANPFAAIESDETVEPSPKETYLLTWNPQRWSWDDLVDDLATYRADGVLEGTWSCGSTRRIKAGDRLFLLRVGSEPRGIMASGRAASSVYEDDHWDGTPGRRALFVKLRYDTLLDPEQDGVLPVDRLQSGRLASVDWTPQSSGTSIDLIAASELEGLWRTFLEERGRSPALPEEVATPQLFVEGASHTIAVNAYERNPHARTACIDRFGAVCSVCGFDFGATYGARGRGFIEVHHLVPLSEIGATYVVDPIRDLRPVCPNCHAMLHRGDGLLTVEELRELMAEASADAILQPTSPNGD
jgi:5-methylcytosine-specific restriction protein A